MKTLFMTSINFYHSFIVMKSAQTYLIITLSLKIFYKLPLGV